MVYKKCSLSITSFTSKLINDSLKSGFCNALQQKRQNISIILLKSPPFNFLIGKYASLIKSGRIIFQTLPMSTLADYSGRQIRWVKGFSLFSELLLQLFSPAVLQGGSSVSLQAVFFLSYSFSSLLSSSCPPAAVFAHFPKCFLATKPSPEQDPNSPTTHR